MGQSQETRLICRHPTFIYPISTFSTEQFSVCVLMTVEPQMQSRIQNLKSNGRNQNVLIPSILGARC